MKRLGRKNKKSMQIIILLLTAILLGCSFFDYAITTRMDSEKELKAQALKNNTLQKLMIEDKLEYITRTLHSFSLISSSFENVHDERLVNLLAQNTDENNLIHMSITDAKGNTYARDGSVYSSRKQAYFKEGLKGNDTISDVVKAPMKQATSLLIMSTPIRKNGKVIGVLHNTFEPKDVKQLLNMQMLSSDFTSNLIGIDGCMVSQDKALENNDYFSHFIKERGSSKDIDALKNAFLKKETGSILMTLQNRREYLYYAPIKNTNWMIVSVLPEQLIANDVQNKMVDASRLAIQIIIIILLIVIYFILAAKKKNQKIRSMNADLDMILGSLPGCMVRFPYQNPEAMEFINDEFYALCGYCKEEYQRLYGNDFRKLVVEEDQTIFTRSLENDVDLNRRYTYSYRILHKDGSIVWLYEHRQLSRGLQHEVWCYSTLVNITELKMTQQKLKISEDRYQMIIEQTESVVFDWDMVRDTITFSPLWESKYGYALVYQDFLSILMTLENVNPMIEVLDSLIKGQKRGNCEFHLPLPNGLYHWCKFSAQSVFDDDGYLLSIFGSIEDIDDMKVKNLELEEKSKRDGMTKVLNKVTIESLIKQTIANEPNHKHLLIVFDIDDFKGINDTYGHGFGDKVLMEISDKLRKSFRQNDCIGRIGGDEFVIFMSRLDCYDNDFIKQKLDYLTKTIREVSFVEHPDFRVTCSVGASLYPLHGKTFTELFQKADKALYVTKRKDKNGFCFYQEKTK